MLYQGRRKARTTAYSRISLVPADSNYQSGVRRRKGTRWTESKVILWQRHGFFYRGAHQICIHLPELATASHGSDSLYLPRAGMYYLQHRTSYPQSDCWNLEASKTTSNVWQSIQYVSLVTIDGFITVVVAAILRNQQAGETRVPKFLEPSQTGS